MWAGHPDRVPPGKNLLGRGGLTRFSETGNTCVSANKITALTLSFPGTRLVHVLAVAIHISPNNGPIEMIPSGKLI